MRTGTQVGLTLNSWGTGGVYRDDVVSGSWAEWPFESAFRDPELPAFGVVRPPFFFRSCRATAAIVPAVRSPP